MGDAGFKHIAVTAADEDDFVIRAGVDAEPESAGGSVDDPAGESAGDSAGEPAGELAGDSVGAQFIAPADPEPAPEPAAKPQPRPKPKKADAYRETTLEDLNAEPMSLTQKIVIVAAIVCIIGAVIYYFAFLR